MNSTIISSNEQYTNIFTSASYSFWFCFLIVCSIFSISCSVLDFYQFIKHRRILIYENITHHIILCLTVNDFIQLTFIEPLAYIYFYFGHTKFLYSTTFCLFWPYFNYVFVTQSLLFTAYAAVERYLLLFHKRLVLKHKILFHYIPLLLTILYLPCVEIYLIFLFPCTHNFDATLYLCGVPCFANSYTVGIINQIVHLLFPVVVLVFFNILIIIKVLIQRKNSAAAAGATFLRSHFWKQNSRMIIQLMAICLLASAVWIPYVTTVLIIIFSDPGLGDSIIYFNILNGAFLPLPTTPFFALIGFPAEIRRNIFISVRNLKTICRTHNRVADIMPRTENN
ncbi:unnamed protein product [Adineta ricciae]|uniref:G-protein coupled receptors family 1 profile domain-containing protein n=1 Tax=Adineta ricciae TaxID=249248 RepID=A0A815NRR4_ADIRI|nr:unnamed protein product [Adineta ricciae]CAF1655581.1 unnamed protein product [Adineta ricciae]